MAKNIRNGNTPPRAGRRLYAQREHLLVREVVVCYYKCPFWPNLVKEFENVLKYAVFSHTL